MSTSTSNPSDKDIFDFFGGLNNDTELNKFFGDNLITALPTDELLLKLEKFIKSYTSKLIDIEITLDETSNTDLWNGDRDPIGLTHTVNPINISNLISSDNTILNKVILVFTVLTCEIDDLSKIAETKFYGPLTMFGRSASFEDDDNSIIPNIGSNPNDKIEPTLAAEVQMGAFLPLVQEIANFVRRLNNVIINLTQQLASLYHERTRLYATTFKHINLNSIFETLGKGIRVMATIDLIIKDNEFIAEGWLAYKRMIKFVRSDPSKFSLDATKLKSFESCLLLIDRTLLSDHLVENLFSSDFGVGIGLENGAAMVSGNRILYDEFSNWLKATQASMETDLGAVEETSQRTKYMEYVCVYALFRRIFKASSKPDTKQFKKIWELQKKAPMVYLYGRVLWFPAEFLLAHAPLPDIYSSLTPNVKPDDLLAFRQEFIKNLGSTLAKKSQEFYYSLAIWMVRFESELMDPKSKHLSNLTAVVNARSKLCLNGILIANSIHNLLSTFICGTLKLNVAFRSDSMRALSVLIESLKVIQFTFHRRSSMMAENLSLMIGQTQFIIKRILNPVKAKLESTPNLDDTKLDVLTAVSVSIDMLSSVPTFQRNSVLNFTLTLVQMKSTLKDEEKDEIKYQVWKLNTLSTFQSKLIYLCDTSYLYFAVDLVPRFLNDYYANSEQIYRLPYLLCALRDCAPMLQSAPAVYQSQINNPIPAHSDRQPHLLGFAAKVQDMVISEIVNPLCREVENDLRLHIHSVALHQESLRNKDMKNISNLVQMKPVRVFNEQIDIRQRVGHYLDTTFYNLNTLALHDWKIYAEMRNLAQEKYGLTLTEVHLPGNSHYSEGLDVLEIMRNIHIFVSKFNYNLNTQIFVERAFDQKHVNSIDIQHIANSIRTHGMGITNTTVNFTYQFLCQKFLIFSEFLYDDHIKSRLIRDVRYFKEKKDELEQRYPYDRADRFNKDIRKLGVSDDGKTYLDQFRGLVTEIGNALGYVRMVRSGVLNTVSSAIKFVPDLTKIINFTEAAIEAKLGEDSIAAAKNLDGILSNLTKNFAYGTDYFKILVAVFVNVLSASDQQHLKNFHAIVPPLTLNFVEKMLEQKERLGKKSKTEASFTDDGFALGLAYILKLLSQYEAFDALHWFDSVNTKLKAEREKCESMKKSKNNEDLQTVQLSITRLNNIQAEFELLFFSFSGARIFFKEADKKLDISATEPEPTATSEVPPATSQVSQVSAPPGPPVGAVVGPPIPPGPPIGLIATGPPNFFPGPPQAIMGPPPAVLMLE